MESNLSDTSLSTNSCLLIAGMSLFHTSFVFVRCLKKVFLFKSSNISEEFLCVAISHFPSPWSVLLVSTLSHLFPPAGHRFGRKHILFVLILSFFPLIRKILTVSPLVPSFPSMSTRMVSARSYHFPSML